MRFRGILLFLFLAAFNAGGQSMNQPKSDCEALMSAVLPFAERMLRDYGEFLPFGGAMRPNSEIVSVAGYDGRERPPSADLIRLLKDSFAKAARDKVYKATALVYDVRVVSPNTGEKTDAIAVALDHRDNYSVVVFVPYKREGTALSFSAMFAQKGDGNVFLGQ
jgi:hypothetical protein